MPTTTPDRTAPTADLTPGPRLLHEHQPSTNTLQKPDEPTPGGGSCQGLVEGVYSQPMATGPGPLRIGEFARRVGVTPELLRAWERRYGLLQPVRSPGGFRLYTDQDAERVARMRRALHEGLSAAEAARAALARGQLSEGLLQGAAARLLAAIERYDEPTAHAVLDESLAAFGLQAVVGDVILPTLTQVGLGWEQGTLQISQEHFASNLIRSRLLSLARLWSRGGGPLALLGCPPGEAHDISLLTFGLLLRSARLANPLPRRRHPDHDTDPNRHHNPTRAHRPHQLQPSTAPSREDRTAPPSENRSTRPQRPRRNRHALHPARRTTPRRRPRPSRHRDRTHHKRLNDTARRAPSSGSPRIAAQTASVSP